MMLDVGQDIVYVINTKNEVYYSSLSWDTSFESDITYSPLSWIQVDSVNLRATWISVTPGGALWVVRTNGDLDRTFQGGFDNAGVYLFSNLYMITFQKVV